ncbi:MAG: phenylalanine--tRNA ligase subunit beta [Candidatus Paceibacterota bacterium]|jgi:phenylalanyl-tRNA synthetase beta chain
MKISHRWLQTYFKKPLPSSDEIAKLLTFHIFEVEDIEKKAEDDILDIKVLPDRASYCLSHEGIARELSALISDNEFLPRDPGSLDSSSDVTSLSVTIEAKDFCDKYLALPILGMTPKATPLWLKRDLEAVGQRSINFLVDLANFAMLDIGQPLHVFDAEKVTGDLRVRYAKEGEKITTLDGKEVVLDSSIAVIADDATPLAIAGIKGGKTAETTQHATHVIVEAAHFNPNMVRKTSGKIGIKNDSSKRFENAVSSESAELALRYFAALLKKEDPEALVGNISEAGSVETKEQKIEVKPHFITEKLGKEISVDEIISCLTRGSIPARREGDMIAVFPPHYRKDLNISEDIVDEVGRLYGYENIEPVLPTIQSVIEPNNTLSWKNIVRNFLVSKGYSEIYTYTLKDKGEIEIANPLASDKSFFRSDLSSAMDQKLKENLYYADLLGLSKIKLFEFGRVFKNGREFLALSIGIAYKKAGKGERVNDEIKEIRDALFASLGSKIEILCTVDDSGGIISKEGKSIGTTNNLDGILEVDFDALIEGLPVQEKDVSVNLASEHSTYKPFSPYPFIVRDVAVFTPADIKAEDVFKVIQRNASDLVVRHELFDVFEKKNKETGEIEKISYGYRLVFQSYEKTLTDEEINKIMEKIADAFKGEKWEVR